MHLPVFARQEINRAIHVEYVHPASGVHATVPAPDVGIASVLLLRSHSRCRKQHGENRQPRPFHSSSLRVEESPLLITMRPLNVVAVTLALPSPSVNSM